MTPGIFEDNYDNGYTLSDITDTVAWRPSELDDPTVFPAEKSGELMCLLEMIRMFTMKIVQEFEERAELNDCEMEDYMEVRKEYA